MPILNHPQQQQEPNHSDFWLGKINEKLAEAIEPATEYQVISSIDPAKLAQHVERAMKMGWRCQGGITMAMITATEPVWAQAMVH